MRACPIIIAVSLIGSVGWLVGCGHVSSVDAETRSKGKLSYDTINDGNGSSSDELTPSGDESPDVEATVVALCHIPPGHPDDAHTIWVSPAATPAHLAHGDYLGPCGGGDGSDADGDGVSDQLDECPDTPEGVDVYANGCTVIVLVCDAGSDITVTAGDVVDANASVQVVQGDYDAANVVFSWQQADGDPADYEARGPALTVQTAGGDGALLFRLTVATHDNLASCADEFVITVVPPQIVDVVAGKWHNVLLMNNETIRPWGGDHYGQLGDGSLMDGVADVDAKGEATLLVRTDGTGWTFGRSVLAGSAMPVQVGGVPAIIEVGALNDGGMLLADTGTVWGFGDAQNANCELAGAQHPGDTGVLGPITIPGLPENMVAVAAGNYHTVALDADGVAWVWGSRFGCTPWPVLDGVVAVAAGQTAFCLFLRDDGTVWGIGYNTFGQLGDGTRVSRFSTPTQALGLTDVVDIAAGDGHSLFVKSDGTLWVSGWNRYCQLGLEDEVTPPDPVYGTCVTAPTQVGITDVVTVAGGYLHSVAVRSDNTVWVWGSNSTGQLTNGTLTTLPGTVCTPMPIEFAGDE